MSLRGSPDLIYFSSMGFSDVVCFRFSCVFFRKFDLMSGL